jgi:hypothetical protein
MSKQDFISLYKKFLSGQCSEEEIRQLESYYSEIKLMDNEWENALGDERRIKEMIMSKIKASTDIDYYQTTKKQIFQPWIWYAASVFFAIITSIFSFHYLTKDRAPNQTAIIIRPGKNQAYLTLANGKSIVLHDAKNGQIAGVSGVIIKKINDSVLTYYANNSEKIHKNTDSNSLTIPRGGVFQTVLSDGTKVWLNSASSLKYPVAFAGKERRVTLVGEAYFEVEKNKAMPFKVSVNGMDVQVLGTHFNVTGYPEDVGVKTTLLQGRVKLHSSAGSQNLVPGQQGVYNYHSRGFEVMQVNTDDIVAWKDGFFVFDNENIQSIMMKIGRWYNVDVVFKNKTSQNNFGGTISRYKNIDAVLKALEATGSVHFKMEGRRVVVMD